MRSLAWSRLATSENCWWPRENFLPKVEMQTLLAHLMSIAGNHPERIALRCGAESMPYGEFCSRILAAAARMRRMGVAEGDRVIICGANTLAIPVLYFAVHALGAVAAPVSPDTPESVLATLAADAEARLAVVQKDVRGIPCPVVAPAAITAWAAGDEELEP